VKLSLKWSAHVIRPCMRTPEACAWNPGGAALVAPSSPAVLHGFGGLPVPALIIANKSDLERDGRHGARAGGVGAMMTRFGGAMGPSYLGNAAWDAWVWMATALRLPAAWRGGIRRGGGRTRGGLLPTTMGDVNVHKKGDGGGAGDDAEPLPNPGAGLYKLMNSVDPALESAWF
jgi:hypothetical protein